MSYLSNIEVDEVDLDLLHDQYQSLVAIQNRLLAENENGKYAKEIEHFEGLCNFLEEIFENHPRDFEPTDKLIEHDVDSCPKCGSPLHLYAQPAAKEYLRCSFCDYRDDNYGFDPAEPEDAWTARALGLVKPENSAPIFGPDSDDSEIRKCPHCQSEVKKNPWPDDGKEKKIGEIVLFKCTKCSWVYRI